MEKIILGGKVNMNTEYLNAIEAGFVLHDEIENEIATLKRIHTGSVDVSCSGNTLKVASLWKNMEAEVEIEKDEIIRKIMDDNVSPKEAICVLLKEKTCVAAHDLKD